MHDFDVSHGKLVWICTFFSRFDWVFICFPVLYYLGDSELFWIWFFSHSPSIMQNWGSGYSGTINIFQHGMKHYVIVYLLLVLLPVSNVLAEFDVFQYLDHIPAPKESTPNHQPQWLETQKLQMVPKANFSFTNLKSFFCMMFLNIKVTFSNQSPKEDLCPVLEITLSNMWIESGFSKNMLDKLLKPSLC